jgi:hypothetical protein
MNATILNDPIERAIKTYDDDSASFNSELSEEIKDLVWSAVNATGDAYEAGVDRSEVKLRAAAFVLRHFAKYGSSAYYERPDSAWDELLASARAARPGVVVPFPKPEGES